MNREYLEDIILKEEIFGYHDEKENRHERWCSQEERFGFCDIETWDLDKAFAQIIYERLMMYLQYAGHTIDLTYHKFEIDFLNTTLTLKEVIDLMIVKTKQAITTVDSDEYRDDMDVVWRLMVIVHKHLWW